MKKFMLRFAQATCLAIMAVCLQSAQCESEEDEDGLPYYNKYVDIKVTQCERVGSVLMVDFTMKNKEDYEITVDLNRQYVTDDRGAEYDRYKTELSIADEKFGSNARVKIASRGTVEGHVRVPDFNPDNKASRVSLEMQVLISNIQLGDKRFEESGIRITDNRVMEHGIQTPDRKLAFAITSTGMIDGCFQIDFTVTNRTSYLLEKITLGQGTGLYPYSGYDNLGNKYEPSRDDLLRVGTDKWDDTVDLNIPAGGTLNCALRVPNVKANATEMTISVRLRSVNVVLEDDHVRFITIPINR